MRWVLDWVAAHIRNGKGGLSYLRHASEQVSNVQEADVISKCVEVDSDMGPNAVVDAVNRADDGVECGSKAGKGDR